MMSYYFWFTEKRIKAIMLVLAIVFVSLIIGQFASLWFDTVQDELGQSEQRTQKVLTKADVLHSILDSVAFGVYIPTDLNEDNIKKSQLDLTLVGVLLADNRADSQVIIRASNGEEKTYAVGDKLPGGALIKRITTDGVLLERNGALERLSLPKNNLLFEAAPKPLEEEK